MLRRRALQRLLSELVDNEIKCSDFELISCQARKIFERILSDCENGLQNAPVEHFSQTALTVITPYGAKSAKIWAFISHIDRLQGGL